MTSTMRSKSDSASSPARNFKSMEAFLQAMMANLRPTPLTPVRAKATRCLPSMLVFNRRIMCWKEFLSAITRDYEKAED